MPIDRVKVADVARKHGTTRRQLFDWRKRLRTGNLVLPGTVAVMPNRDRTGMDLAHDRLKCGNVVRPQPRDGATVAPNPRA